MSKSPKPETSPAKNLAEELDYLRKQLRESLAAYTARLEAEIVELKEIVMSEAAGDKLTLARARDVRDLIILLRNLSIRPDKGRRKDLKRIETALADLRLIIDNW